MTRRSFLFALPAVGASMRPQSAGTSTRDVLAAADRYLVEYRRALIYLLADERYEQRATTTGSGAERRRLEGELFVTFLAGDRAWIAVHDFSRVDGVPVEGHEALRDLLRRDSVAGVARQLVNRNARFNLGAIVRNFNEPTLGLRVLEPSRRRDVEFDRESVDRDGDATLATLAFRERGPATLVRGIDGRAIRSHGVIALEAGTGRVRRTHMEFEFDDVTARLATEYAPDANLGLWLPRSFSETYRRGDTERVDCTAAYTNWRRFDVDVKIR